MTSSPSTHRVRRRVVDAWDGAWVAAAAFTKPSHTRAVLAFPLMLWTFTLAALQGGVCLSPDRNGTVLIYRHRLWLNVLITVLLVTVPAMTLAVLAVATNSPALLNLITVGLWVFLAGVVVGVLAVGPNRAVFTFSAGSGTPRGRRWLITAVAQRPGTTMSATQTALRRIRELPSGDVLVVIAGNQALAARYQRLGFQPDTAGSLRLHLLIDDHTGGEASWHGPRIGP